MQQGHLGAPASVEAPAGTPLAAADLRDLHRELRSRHGPQGWWWPGQDSFEIAVGAVLVQRSRWEQAATSIANLRAAGLLEARALASAPEQEVRELVRGSGFPTSKPPRLLAVARWVVERSPQVPHLSDDQLRAELLGVDGIGEETADAISLYCFVRAAFICDEYARRLLTARGLAVPRSYRAFARQIAPVVDRAGLSVPELAELHGLIVEEGKRAGRRDRSVPGSSPGSG